MKIRSYEIQCERHFSRYHINLLNSYLSDPWKLDSLRLNLRLISVILECENYFSNLSQYNCTLNSYLSDCCIRVTILLEYFDLFDNVSLAMGPLTRWGLLCYFALVLGGTEDMFKKASWSWSCLLPCDHVIHLRS